MTPVEQLALYEKLVALDDAEAAFRVAFQELDDRKRVLAFAAHDVIFCRGTLARLAAFMSPWPTKLEAIEQGGMGCPFELDLVRHSSIGFAIAIPLTSIAFYLHDVSVEGFWEYRYYAVVLAITLVLGLSARAIFSFGLRRRIAELAEDEAGTFAYVIARLNEAIAEDATRGPWVLSGLRTRFRPRGMKNIWMEHGLARKLDKRRSWTATFERHDPARAKAVFRVRLFDDKQPAGDLFAEVDAPLRYDGYPVYKDLSDRIHAVALTGKSNVPTLGARRSRGASI